jgi:hypothetical protein
VKQELPHPELLTYHIVIKGKGMEGGDSFVKATFKVLEIIQSVVSLR